MLDCYVHLFWGCGVSSQSQVVWWQVAAHHAMQLITNWTQRQGKPDKETSWTMATPGHNHLFVVDVIRILHPLIPIPMPSHMNAKTERQNSNPSSHLFISFLDSISSYLIPPVPVHLISWVSILYSRLISPHLWHPIMNLVLPPTSKIYCTSVFTFCPGLLHSFNSVKWAIKKVGKNRRSPNKGTLYGRNWFAIKHY